MNDTKLPSLAHLSNVALLESLTNVSRRHQALTAELVLHLLEMDRRKLYLERAKSSLFVYCLDCLGYSEDEAYRRIEAARIVAKYPAILACIDNGSVSLTVLGKLKPFLAPANVDELLDLAAHRCVRDVERILAAKFPKGDVPDSIRTLPKRQSSSEQTAKQEQPVSRPANPPAPPEPKLTLAPPVDRGRLDPLSADRILVKFTASRAFEAKLKQARDLMSHSNPKGDLATVLEAALDLLILEKSKAKFGATTRPARKKRAASRSRVTNQTRREVLERDGMRCSYIDAEGNRCDATAFLELEHREEKSRGGGSGTKNVRIYCRAHNQHAAEKTFGRDFMNRKRKSRELSVKDSAHVSYLQHACNSPASTRAAVFGWPDEAVLVNAATS